MTPMNAMLRRRAFLLGSAAIGLGLRANISAARAKRDETLHLPGVGAPIEVLEDAAGITHVRARTIADAFFANGYIVARDRLWELDFNHRQSLGRLAEVFGPEMVEFDTANRLVLFQGDAEAELAHLPDAIQAAARAYVAGIDARLDEVSRSPDLLSPEFSTFDYAPIRWDVLDLIRIRAELTGNTKAEIRRARLAARGGLAFDTMISPLQPHHELHVPAGLDVAAVSEADLGLFGVLQKSLPLQGLALPNDVEHHKRNAGSNAWVVSPTRTATGRPILANDPHLGLSEPGPRHVIHLTAPGLDVIGGGTAGMPGVMQGHTANFAFGRTNFHIDQEDLFVLKTNPSDPERYFHQGQWKTFEQVTTRIMVRGAPVETVILRYAAQGPVVSRDVARQRAVSVSATWLAPGANGLLANIGINLAHDWSSFRGALRLHTSPTNFTYADTQGAIGWQAAGGLPQRAAGHDGLMPAPGGGQFDWQGLQKLEALPSSFNPPSGWFSTSNEMNLPPDYPAEERRVSFEWRDRFRHDRIEHVLASTPQVTIADCVALQHDTLSLLAVQVVRLLPETGPSRLTNEMAMLRAWDGRVDADSAAAALYEVWWTHIERALHARAVPQTLQDLLSAPISGTTQLSFLQNPETVFGDHPVQARDQMLMDALLAASNELRERLGPLPAAWRWGSLHRIEVRHPLSGLPDIARQFPAIGGQGASGGDPYTVMARWYNAAAGGENPYAVTGGASYLMVCDVGAWDNSVYLNFPGQSGDPRSIHYADGVADWEKGSMQKLVFSEEQVRRSAVRSVVMQPLRHGP